ncbi:MAG: VOC family protein [Pseudomonadota bacterium]
MINGINHITLSVKDVEKSFEFYKDILSLKPVAKWKNGAYLTAANPAVKLIVRRKKGRT